MPDVISDTNGKLCVGSYHMWRLLSNPDNYSLNFWSLEIQQHLRQITGETDSERQEISNLAYRTFVRAAITRHY